MIDPFKNKHQTFHDLTYWEKWFNSHFDHNISVNYHPSVRERAYYEIIKKINEEESRSQS